MSGECDLCGNYGHVESHCPAYPGYAAAIARACELSEQLAYATTLLAEVLDLAVYHSADVWDCGLCGGNETDGHSASCPVPRTEALLKGGE